MFTFYFMKARFRAEIDDEDQAEVVQLTSGFDLTPTARGHAQEALERVTVGQYYPDPNERVLAWSDALGGDFKYESKPPAEPLPADAVA